MCVLVENMCPIVTVAPRSHNNVVAIVAVSAANACRRVGRRGGATAKRRSLDGARGVGWGAGATQENCSYK